MCKSCEKESDVIYSGNRCLKQNMSFWITKNFHTFIGLINWKYGTDLLLLDRFTFIVQGRHTEEKKARCLLLVRHYQSMQYFSGEKNKCLLVENDMCSFL